MPQPLPLSITLITRDEEERVGAMLAACRGLSDDVVVVDSGSTDRTLEIARAYTDRVFHRDWEGFGPQKRYAADLCRNRWILNLDADEILSPETRDEIRAVFDLPPESRAPAYALRIVHVSRFSKDLKPRPFAPANVTPRLYDRERAGFREGTLVHDKVILEPKYKGTPIPVLGGAVAHMSFRSFSHMWGKIHDYAVLQAEEKFRAGKKPRIGQIIYDPPLFWLKYMILRRMAFLGTEGWIVATAHAAGRALRIGMTLERFREADKNPPERTDITAR